ncbi:MAG TPA: accessory factor UbiK family protein [Burkholderiaceae bacterium]|nr:accessory factor UbiK family protein [Burkholderiaceae bacterium]
MTKPSALFEEIQRQVSALLAQSPARDLERNVRAVLSQGFARLDLVTREDFDVQKEVLARTRAKLTELEARVAELEARLNDKP